MVGEEAEPVDGEVAAEAEAPGTRRKSERNVTSETEWVVGGGRKHKEEKKGLGIVADVSTPGVVCNMSACLIYFYEVCSRSFPSWHLAMKLIQIECKDRKRTVFGLDQIIIPYRP